MGDLASELERLWDERAVLEGPAGDHLYSPDHQAMGDCNHCGHTPQAHEDNPRVTRALKAKAHKAFDRIWQSGKMTRSAAYRWLSVELGVVASEAHMAAMSRHAVLEKVIIVSEAYMGEPLAASDFPEDDYNLGTLSRMPRRNS